MWVLHVTCHVRPDAAERFAEWKQRHAELQAAAPGFVRSTTVRSQKDPDTWYYLSFWETHEQAQALTASDAFRAIFAEYAPRSLMFEADDHHCEVIVDQGFDPDAEARSFAPTGWAPPLIRQDIQSAGQTLATYHLATPGAKHKVLLVHGLTVSGPPVWDVRLGEDTAHSLMVAISRLEVEPWCLDLRGYGNSDTPPGGGAAAGPETALADITAALEAMRQSGATRTSLGGFSWGGVLAARYAAANPDQVHRLLLVAPAIRLESRPGTVVPVPMDEDGYHANTRDSLLERVKRYEGDSDVIRNTWADTVLAAVPRSPVGPRRALMAEDGGVVPGIERLTMPTRIVIGTDDPIWGAGQMLPLLGAIPAVDRRFDLIPDCDHWWMVQPTAPRFIQALVSSLLD